MYNMVLVLLFYEPSISIHQKHKNILVHNFNNCSGLFGTNLISPTRIPSFPDRYFHAYAFCILLYCVRFASPKHPNERHSFAMRLFIMNSVAKIQQIKSRFPHIFNNK